MITMELQTAIALLKSNGYRVSKPRAAKMERQELNAIGKPFSPSYDPNYRMKYKTPCVPYGLSTAGMSRGANEYRKIIERQRANAEGVS